MTKKEPRHRIDPNHVDQHFTAKEQAPGSDDAFGGFAVPGLGLWDDDTPSVSDEYVKKRTSFDRISGGMLKTVELADKLATVMKKKGLKQARAKCPDCAGYLQGRLNGPRAYRFWCDGTCGKALMS